MVDENSETGDIITCPTCKRIWPKGTKFCTQCGTWIESGEVVEPTPGEPPSAAGPTQPSVGPSPPGIGPGQPSVGPSPPGIGPTQPSVGPSPPGISPTQPSVGPSPPGTGPTQPGATPEQVPTAPVAPAEGAQEGEPPKKKYALKIEPHREEHLPEGPVFLPKRETKKKKAITPGQVVLIVLCVLAIAYAVISMAFKPLHGYLLGMFFETIGKSETAVEHYKKAAGGDSAWAESAAKAMTRIGKRVFAKHLELQYYNNWTANSKISLSAAGRQIEFASTIAYKAPGFVVEDITRDGRPAGKRLINNTLFAQRFGGLRQQITADQYARWMSNLVELNPDKLFKESGKADVLKAFFDDLQMQLKRVNKNDETVYVFSSALDGDRKRAEKFSILSGPFFPWSSAATRTEIAKITYSIRAEDGFLVKTEYADSRGTRVVVQTFSDFEPGADIDDARFRPRR